jgi:hypothetical protein
VKKIKSTEPGKSGRNKVKEHGKHGGQMKKKWVPNYLNPSCQFWSASSNIILKHF